MKRQGKLGLAVALTVLSILGMASVSWAQGATAVDAGTVSDLIGMLMSGKYIPAVGAFLIAAVTALRGLLGGYVLGFGAAAVLYVAVAMQADQLSIGVLAAALGAGWAAAGGWNHLQDLLGWLTPPPPSKQQPVVVTPTSGPGAPLQAAIVLGVVAICMVSGGLMMQACSGAKHAETAVIDCTGGTVPGVVANVLETLSDWSRDETAGGCRTATGYDWGCVESKAIAKGEQVGGCAIAELVQTILGGTKATPVSDSWLARAALEDFRARAAGGATFHTPRGDL
jgi:hypothetical protein